MKQLKQPYFIYLLTIAAIGIIIVSVGLIRLPTYQPLIHFLLFIILVIFAQFITTSFSISEDAGITYQVASAVSMAVIPFFGPFAAALVDAIAAITLWIIKPPNKTTWKKSRPQLAFNLGMGSIAAFAAGVTYYFFINLLGANIIGFAIAWTMAAIVNDQLNLWLLIGIIWLQHEQKISPWAIWQENMWAMPISILLMSIGGALLAYSLNNFGPIGLAVFFLPILLSAIAFRLYVKKMQSHMDNLEQMVHERTHELQELNERKDAFLAVLTHDMITPLTSMRLFTELIRDDPTAPAEDPEFIEPMIRSQNHLHRLLQNILDLEKLNSGQELAGRKTNIDLIPLLNSVVSMVQAEAREKNISIRCNLEPSNLNVYADENQIERIFLNVLANGVKYTPVNGKIFVSAEVNGRYAQIVVSDTGYGIPKSELPFIFQRFRRVQQLKDKATGTGLGLAITKALVEEHDGSITVTSQEGKGSTFTLQFPLPHLNNGNILKTEKVLA